MFRKGYKPKSKLGTGTRFAALSGGVQEQYIKKGYPAKKAAAIGAAVAAKQGVAAHGKKQMSKWAKAGKK